MPAQKAFVSWDPRHARRQAPTDTAFLACYATGDVAHLTQDAADAMTYPTTKVNIQVLRFLLYSVFNAAWERGPGTELDATIISPLWVEMWNRSSRNSLPGLLRPANPLTYRWIIWPTEVESGNWALLLAINASSLAGARPGPLDVSGTSLAAQNSPAPPSEPVLLVLAKADPSPDSPAAIVILDPQGGSDLQPATTKFIDALYEWSGCSADEWAKQHIPTIRPPVSASQRVVVDSSTLRGLGAACKSGL